MKPKNFYLILFSFLFLLLIPTRTLAVNTSCVPIQTFTDISEKNKFCPYIKYLAFQKVVSESENFNPEKNLNRGQLSKMIVEGFQLEINENGEKFPDVPEDHTFYKYIMTLKNSNIIKGYPNGKFGPSDNVNRGAILKFIVNSGRYNNDDAFDQTTNDINKIFSDIPNDHSFAEFIGRAYLSSPEEMKIISGYADKTFRVENEVTRAEASKIISNSMLYKGTGKFECQADYCQDKIIESIEHELSEYLFGLINDSRLENDLEMYVYNEKVAIVAKDWSSEMNISNTLKHREKLPDKISLSAIEYNYVSENVAYSEILEGSDIGYFKDRVKRSHNNMMAEVAPADGHKKTILSTKLNEVGIGVKISDINDKFMTIWITENFIGT